MDMDFWNTIRLNGLTVQEWRFITLYLARIDGELGKPSIPRVSKARFTLKELQDIMETDGMSMQTARGIADRMMRILVSVGAPAPGGGCHTSHLFKEYRIGRQEEEVILSEEDQREFFGRVAYDPEAPRKYEPGYEPGTPYLDIDMDAYPFRFVQQNPAEYFAYHAWNAMILPSYGAMVMYIELKKRERLGKWIVPARAVAESLTEDLSGKRALLTQENIRYEDFMRRTIEPIQESLAAGADIVFTCEPYERDTAVVIFTISRNARFQDPFRMQRFIAGPPKAVARRTANGQDENPYIESLKYFSSAFHDEFSLEQIQTLDDLSPSIFTDRSIYRDTPFAYFKKKFSEAKKCHADNRYEYIYRAMLDDIKKGVKDPIRIKRSDVFDLGPMFSALSWEDTEACAHRRENRQEPQTRKD